MPLVFMDTHFKFTSFFHNMHHEEECREEDRAGVTEGMEREAEEERDAC